MIHRSSSSQVQGCLSVWILSKKSKNLAQKFGFVVDYGCAYKILASGKLIKIKIISTRPLTIYTWLT